MTLSVHVLGSAAGGGYPQWNCNCRQCAAARAGQPGHQARTQSSIAVRGRNGAFALINASPDIRAQILANPALQPARQSRDTAIAGIVLMDAQIDHVTGLLMLRESSQPLQLWCTARVYEDLNRHFPLVPMLQHYCGVDWHEITADGSRFTVDGVDGVSFSAVALRSKAPPYSPHRQDPQPGDNIGLMVEGDNGHRLFYAPGLGEIGDSVLDAMAAADTLLVDGTTWTDDEMARSGVGHKLARDMGHLPQTGADGMIALLSRYPHKRRILIHINNTNPILDEHGSERAQLHAAGIEVAYDGQTIALSPT